MLKKTRPEKAEKPNVYLDQLGSPQEGKDSMVTKDPKDSMVLPSNPYQVKPEPNKSVFKKEAENPYAVRKEPDNPYAVKKEPANPYSVKKEPDNPYSVKKEPNNPYEGKKHPNSKSRVSNRFRDNFQREIFTKPI